MLVHCKQSTPVSAGAEAAPTVPSVPAAPAAEDAGFLPVQKLVSSGLVSPADADADAGAAPKPPAVAPPGMLLVPGGTFTMGSDSGGEEDEHPAHKVTVASFFLDRTEVTQAMYFACVKAGICAEPQPGILDRFGGRFRGPERPIVGVSWFDAHKFCTNAGKRLPREAEYERAVRGEDGRKYPWGTQSPTKALSVYQSSNTEDVGSRPLGRGPHGHDDLAGNVWEWIDDDYDPLAYSRDSASTGTPGSCKQILEAQDKLRREGREGYTGSNPIPSECEKSIRGGAYNYGSEGLRSTNRIHHPARFRLLMTGFRCAKDAT